MWLAKRTEVKKLKVELNRINGVDTSLFVVNCNILLHYFFGCLIILYSTFSSHFLCDRYPVFCLKQTPTLQLPTDYIYC